MDVKFITTTDAKLSSVPIIDGQIIAIADAPGYYYDMGSERHRTSQVQLVTELPSIGVIGYLYVCTYPEGLFLWTGTRFSKLNEAPTDGRKYVRKDGKWCILPYDIEEVLETSTVTDALADLFEHQDSVYLRVEGSVSCALSIVVPKQKVLYLDFTNAHIKHTESEQLISAQNDGLLTITGLAHFSNYKYPVSVEGEGHTYIRDCVFVSEGTSVAIRCYNRLYLNDCHFKLDDVDVAIQLYSSNPIARICHCIFDQSKDIETAGKVCNIIGSKDSMIIVDNYMPVDSITVNGSITDVSYTNICK